ncbi:hypothetical protein GCM10009718_24530 [Isoptericola halotolerans]|uniref:AcrR family transcriptional regulator n=1 Tax=Isoptericola halotolerans TaxID=300560 RepID=A0ABX2A871_9MICO|nr:TetR/AcrR family transcriptional regulator [Isoptericola halotolerans]NOV97982.1 AcrR family transcriptional regulator [Isoptericola halotolerans]
MPRDTTSTRERLLDAGGRQFAATGFAGTSVDAVSRDAGVNKERIYAYFGSKRRFFDHVLTHRLDGLLDGLDLDGHGEDALGRWAGRLWDRYAADPDVARLLAWESLELDEPAAAVQRVSSCSEVASHLRDALAVPDDASARQLLLSVVMLVTSAWTLTALTALVAPGTAAAARRTAVVEHATALARATLLVSPRPGR